MVIDSMVANNQLDESLMEKVREAMLKRHHHQNEKKLSNRIPLVRSIADIGKKHSDSHLLERNGETLRCTPLFPPPPLVELSSPGFWTLRFKWFRCCQTSTGLKLIQ